MSRAILSCMLACFAISFAFSKDPLVSAFSFQSIDNAIFIQASAGDQTGFFLLDSGSPNLLLNARHFDARRIEVTNFHSADLTGLAAGNLKKTCVHLRVDKIEKRNQEAFLIDLSSIEKSKKIDILGVIGYKFLKHFEVVFNYQLKKITLFALDGRGERKTKASLHTFPDQVVGLKKSRHLLYLEAQVNGETMKLGLDCGAEKSVLDKEAVRKFENNFTPSHSVSLVAFNGKKSGVVVGSVKQVFIGNTELELSEIVVMDISPINRNLVIKLDGLLGNGFLSRSKIAINYKKQTLAIWDPAWLAQR